MMKTVKTKRATFAAMGLSFILFCFVFSTTSYVNIVQPQSVQNEVLDHDDDGVTGSPDNSSKCSSWTGSVGKASSDLNMADILNKINFSDIYKTTEEMNLDSLMASHHWTGDVGRLKVIIVPHSHNDPGWLETFESYYLTKTKRILNLILENLSADPSLKFIWAEISFFSLWWEDLSEADRMRTKKILENGQLEFVNGGWVMPDEANTHYFSLVTQLIEGQIWLKQHLNYETKTGWTLDPFGLSPIQAYLMRLTGIKNLVIQRVHYAVKRYLAEQNELEFNWRQIWDSKGSSDADILCHVMPYSGYTISNTCGPRENVCCQLDFFYLFSVSHGDPCAGSMVTDEVTPSNVHERSKDLVDSYRRKSLLYKTNTLLIPLGDDFRWSAQPEWTAQVTNYKRLIEHVNRNPDIFNMDIKIGSLQDYFDMVWEDILARKFEPKSLTGDFFPYVDHFEDYWTGYFTSRPFHKGAEREVAAILRSTQISFSILLAQLYQKDLKSMDWAFVQNMLEKIVQSRRQLSLFQHHDGITGTSKEVVVIDYAQRLFQALKDCEHVMQQSLFILTSLKNPQFSLQTIQNDSKFFETIFTKEGPLEAGKVKSISFDQNDTERVIVVFNSDTKIRTQLINIGLTASVGGFNDVDLILVEDSAGNEMESEIFPVFKKDDGQLEPAVVRLSFLATIGPLETKRFFVRQTNSSLARRKINVAKVRMSHAPSDGRLHHSVFGVIKFLKKSLKISNHHTKLSFNLTSGLVQKAFVNGTEIPFGIKFMAYRNTGSGMYLFKPSGPAEDLIVINAGLKGPPKVFQVRGKLYSYVQVWFPQIKHRIGLYNHAGLDSQSIHVENTVDLRQESENFELIMRMETGIGSRDRFYTDLNGFQMTQRQTRQNLPLAGNYYPVPTSAFIEDDKLRMSILTGQPLGGSSLSSGQLELMLDRRLYQDDGKGLGGSPRDNLETDYKFQILLETRKESCPVATTTEETHKIIEKISMLSLPATIQLNSLLNPLHTFVQPKVDDLGQNFDHEIENSDGGLLPCDVHLVGLFPQSIPSRRPFEGGPSKDRVTPVAGVVVRRVGFDDNFLGQVEIGKFCGMDRLKGFSVRNILGNLVQPKVQRTSLNFGEPLSENASLRFDDHFQLERMEIFSFLVSYNHTQTHHVM